MERSRIDRINELARLKKLRELTEEELAEREILRKEYIEVFRRNFRTQLESIEIVDENEV